MKETKIKYKKVLMSKDCDALNLALREKITKNPKFLYNFIDNGVLPTNNISVEDDWRYAKYLILKEKAKLEDIKKDDILAYVCFSLNKPTTNVNQISLMSFCNDINLVCEIAGDMCEHLYDNFKTKIIAFSGVEAATTYRLFEKIVSNQELSDKLFPNWVGRYIGYKTDSFIAQDNTRHNNHMFELLRKGE